MKRPALRGRGRDLDQAGARPAGRRGVPATPTSRSDAAGEGTRGRQAAHPLSADLAVAWMVIATLAMAVASGIPASPLSPALAPGAAPLPPLRGLARATGLAALSPTGRAAVAIAVVVFAALGFLYALREAWRGNLSVPLVVGLGVAFSLVAVALPLLFSRDVYSYGMYGRIASVHHANPYVATPEQFRSDPLFPFVGPLWRDTPAVYGPAFTMLSAGISSVVRTPAGLVLAFKLLSGAAAVATILLVARLARRLWPARAAFAIALFAWNPAVFAQGVGGGHNDLLVGLAVVAGLTLLAGPGRSQSHTDAMAAPDSAGPGPVRELAATIVLTLGMLVKATAAIPLALAICLAVVRRPRGARARIAGTHLCVVAILSVAFAAPYFQTSDPTLGMADLATHQGWLAPTRFLLFTLGGLGETVGGAVGRDVMETVVRVVMPLAFVAAFLLIARSVVQRAIASRGGGFVTRVPATGTDVPAVAQGAAWAWALLLFTLAAPVLLPWYVVWTMPVAWLLPRRALAGAVGVSFLLAISLTLAEPALIPFLYNAILWVGHYVFAPVLLVAFGWLVQDLRRRVRGGAPLEPVAAPMPPKRERVAAGGHTG